MKRRNLFTLYTLGAIVLLTSCGAPAGVVGENTSTPAVEGAWIYTPTAEAKTATAEIQENTVMISEIVATKYAEGTKVAATMTAIPTGTPIPPTMTIPANSGFCNASDLKAKVIQGSPATGGLFLFYMTLTNISAKPCYVWAWPDIQFLDRQRRPLEVRYSYEDPNEVSQSVTATKSAMEASSVKVGLSPQSSASINMGWRNWCGGDLDEGIIIRLILIDGKEMVDVPTDVRAYCDYPGNPSEVTVSRLVGVVNTTPISEKY